MRKAGAKKTAPAAAATKNGESSEEMKGKGRRPATGKKPAEKEKPVEIEKEAAESDVEASSPQNTNHEEKEMEDAELPVVPEVKEVAVAKEKAGKSGAKKGAAGGKKTATKKEETPETKTSAKNGAADVDSDIEEVSPQVKTAPKRTTRATAAATKEPKVVDIGDSEEEADDKPVKSKKGRPQTTAASASTKAKEPPKAKGVVKGKSAAKPIPKRSESSSGLEDSEDEEMKRNGQTNSNGAAGDQDQYEFDEAPAVPAAGTGDKKKEPVAKKTTTTATGVKKGKGGKKVKP